MMPDIFEMSEVVSKSIINQYCEIEEEGVKVIILKKNSYINASKLCMDNGKLFPHWLEKRDSDQLIKELMVSTNLVYDEIVIPKKDVPNEIRGKYIHPVLIPHVAMWISPSCAIKITSIFNALHLKEVNDKNTKLAIEKDSKIEDFKNQVSELTENIKQLSLENREKCDNLHSVLGDRVVRPKNPDLLNTVVIYQKNNKQFYIIRGQRLYVEKALEKYLTNNPRSTEFAKIEYNPNAINYYVRFKEELKGKIKWTYNDFTLVTINENELKDYIQKIDAAKYEFE